MKKTLFSFFLFSLSLFSFSQETFYGISTGSFYYDIDNREGVIRNGAIAQPPFSVGVFADRHLGEKIGFKTSLNYNSVTELYSTGNEFRLKQKSIALTPHFKFDTGGDYNKGFYLSAGPRISFILTSETLEGIKVKDFYNTTNFGVQLGFGINFLKHFGFEAIGDYGLSDTIKYETKGKTAGIYGNFLINLESIFSK